MLRAFKYRLFTNANQDRELGIALESHRRLYNEYLGYRQMAWDCLGVGLTYVDCSRWFKGQRSRNPYFARINFSSAQATMRRLDKTFVSFFRRVKAGDAPGYPRFKSQDRFNSIEFPRHGDGIRLNGNRLRVQHVGTICVKLHRPVEGKVKTVSLVRETGKWYVVLLCELSGTIPSESTKPAVGIDMGLTHFITLSDGTRKPNPRYIKTALPAIRIASRNVSSKTLGGKNRRKAIVVLQKLHARVRNLRREHHYQVATCLVLAYGLFAVERLNIQEMLKSRRFSRAISDAGWSGFLNILKHKAAKAGAKVVEVDPSGTSQQCSGCGHVVPKTLRDRWHKCPYCGLSLDRDHNAALNILARGLARTGPATCNVNNSLHSSRSSRVDATV